MRTAVLTILVFLITIGHSWAQEVINQLDTNGQKQGYWEKKQPNGKLLYTGYLRMIALLGSGNAITRTG